MRRYVIPIIALTLACGCAHLDRYSFISPPGPRHVTIIGKSGSFELLVDSQPYYVRGVGFNIDNLRFAERELRAAKETGFNCLRFWGRGQVDLAGLDLAEKYGLTCVPAWWLSQDKADHPTARNYANADQNAKELQDILTYVNKLKDHPAVLMWGIGNEAYEFGEQGTNFCKFLNEVCRAIHKADPNHPVMYAAVNDGAVDDFKVYVPDLDVYGANCYSGWTGLMSISKYVAEELGKPVVFTEFGPGLPETNPDWTFVSHGWDYADCWKEGIVPYRGYNLGGFFFHFHDSLPGRGYWGMYDCDLHPRPVIHQSVQNVVNWTGGVDMVRSAVAGDGFNLEVNGTPYFVRGVNMQSADLAATNLLLAATMNLNTVRISYDALTKKSAELLADHALKAIVRFDLQPECSGTARTGRDYADGKQNRKMIDEIVRHVDAWKNDSSVLLWELGSGTIDGCVHREAFAQFLNRLAAAVKRADPSHPTAHTLNYDNGLRELARFTPHVDIIGQVSQIGAGQLVAFATRVKEEMHRPCLFMTMEMAGVGDDMNEKTKIWNDARMWEDGVLRSRPFALGGCYRDWRDAGKEYGLGFVRRDGTPKDAEINAVRELLMMRSEQPRGSE